MSIVESIRRKVLRAMVFFCILPPLPVVLAMLIISKILEDPKLFFISLAIFLPIIMLFTSLKIWLWRSIYLEPLEKLSNHIENLKNMGYRVDDVVYEVLPESSTVIKVKNYNEIPKNRSYRLAALRKGKRYIVFVGIVDDYGLVYDLTDI